MFILFILRERKRERRRDRERMQAGEGQRERERERGRESIPGRLHAVSGEPSVGLELTNHEIMP